jgi:L,D-transpeptidase catalytic domain
MSYIGRKIFVQPVDAGVRSAAVHEGRYDKMEILMIWDTTRTSLVAAAVALLATLVLPAGAMAAGKNGSGGGDVLFFGDSFGGGMVGGAQVVSFSPRFAPGQLVVSFGDRRLYLIRARGQALAYPIAIPKEEARWAGSTVVSQKRVNPPWTPTATMRAQNRNLPSYVPGGHPMNPMGVRALYLGSSTYRIHGTDAPWTIGTAASKGCIRMFNEDVIDLYARVPVGARVLVTWDRFAS